MAPRSPQCLVLFCFCAGRGGGWWLERREATHEADEDRRRLVGHHSQPQCVCHHRPSLKDIDAFVSYTMPAGDLHPSAATTELGLQRVCSDPLPESLVLHNHRPINARRFALQLRHQRRLRRAVRPTGCCLIPENRLIIDCTSMRSVEAWWWAVLCLDPLPEGLVGCGIVWVHQPAPVDAPCEPDDAVPPYNLAMWGEAHRS